MPLSNTYYILYVIYSHPFLYKYTTKGLIGLAASILLVGFSRSVVILSTARAASGLCAGALVARWDLTLLGKRFSPYAEERMSRRAPEKPIACVSEGGQVVMLFYFSLYCLFNYISMSMCVWLSTLNYVCFI